MKQLFRFSILLLALLLPALAMAYDFEVDGIYYNINGNEATVTHKNYSFGVYSGSVVIPITVTYDRTTYWVTAIDDYSFYGCSGLTSITIPNSVTEIGALAFSGCSGLTSITIPNTVTTIKMQTFWGCTGLTSFTIPNSVTSIGDEAFRDCSGLTSIDIPNSVTSIGFSAFYGCTALTSIDIPNSVTSLGYGVFFNCPGLTSIVVESGNPKYDSRNNCNAIIETASNTLIYGCKNTAIPNSVTAIGDNAFGGCSGLTSIDIPNSVTSIADAAFWGCSGLTSITIPNSVTSIGDNAFSYCTGLTSVNIHDLDAWCKIDFNNFYSNPLCFAHHLFIDGEETTDLVIPESITNIGDYAFCNCSGLTSIDIPNSVTSIGEKAFSGCSGLTSIGIPNSVTSIGEEAFSGCSGLTSVTIPNSVTSVGGKAFYNCSGLTDVYCYFAKPLSVSIGSGVFDLYDWDESGRTLHVLPGTTEHYYYMDWYWYFDQVIEDLIPEPQPGDVNGDGSVNISDVTVLIDYLLSGNASGINLTSADCNQDSSVNISDVTALIDYLLSGIWN